MTDRKHAITRVEINGYAIDPLSATLTPVTPRSPSLMAALRAGYAIIYPKDPIFREQIGSLENKSAQTGNLHMDRATAAWTLHRWVEQNRPEALKRLGEKAPGWIKTHGLPMLMKEYGQDRQSRYRKALLLAYSKPAADEQPEAQS